MTEKDQIIERINQVATSPGQLKEDQFRSVLGALVKKGGREAEALLLKYLNHSEIPTENRINIVLTAGDLQNPGFLMPLKNLLDLEPNIHVKKATVLAIGKFNNQKALNILNSALPTVGNPLLKSTVMEQIDHIKKNNPILALLPRFLKGDKDKKGFMVVIDLLKKNMTPADVPSFTAYLRSEDASIQKGAFEILCYTGDRTLQSDIFEYYFEKGEHLDPANTEDIDLFASLTALIKEFFFRFPSLIFTQLAKLKLIYPRITDSKTQRIFLSLFCHCRGPEALTFIKDVYEKSDQELRDYIVEESTGNEQAVDFLFEKYREGQILKESVIKALLKNPKGFQYFTENFFSFDTQSQETIVKNLPDTLQTNVVDFIKTLFKSDQQNLKKFLLSKIRINYLYSFKDILFEPERQTALFALEDDYIETITRMFPVLSIKHLMERTLNSENDIYRIKVYFNHIQGLINYEPILTFKDQNVLSLLATKLINFNNPELNSILLNILEKAKTFEPATYRGMYDAMVRFADQRGPLISDDETHAVKRVKENYKTIVEDLKRIESMEKEVKRSFMKGGVDFNQLKKSLEALHLGVVFNIKWVTHFIAENFRKTEDKNIANWREFFKDLPIMTQLVREAFASEETTTAMSTPETFHDKLRIVIRFQESTIAALFKDQINEMLPHFKTVMDTQQLESTDILVCDGYFLKEYITSKTLNTKRIYLYLENRADFGLYKALNPRAFFPPLSLYKILRTLLSELYLMKPS